MDTVRIVNLSFQIWGSSLTMLIMIYLIAAKKTRTKGDRLYFSMLACNMGAMLMDAVALYFRGKMGDVAWFGVRSSNYLQFFAGNLLPFLFLNYIIEYIEESVKVKISKKYTELGTVLLAVSQILITLNLIFPFLYEIDEHNIYSRLPLNATMYVPIYASLLLSMILIFKYWNKIKRNAAITFLIYSIIPAVSVVIGIFFYGITFSYIGTTCALTILFFHLQLEREQNIIVQDATDKVEQLIDYEKLVNEAIRTSMEAEDPNENINDMLRFLGNMLEGDRVYIYERDDTGRGVNTYEWCADGVTPFIDKKHNLSPDICSQWSKRLKEEQLVLINSTEDVKDKPFLYDALVSRGINSLAIFPLWNNHRMIGFLGIDNSQEDAPKITPDIFEIIANFMVALFKKRDLIRELQRLSYTDPATGARNRLAMYDYFDTLRNKKNIGVVFCDITGLKETNDTRGHSAGDDLIKNTYLAIQKGFDCSNIFRIGGDEFVVLCDGISESDLLERVETVKAALMENEVIAAIGSQWRPWAAETVKATIIKAEENMYTEKNAWYKENGKEIRSS
ncbi:MAG: diguanylate cyclase [Eubacteriales bacterium]